MDKAGKEYWGDFWQQQELPAALDPDKSSINNYPLQVIHKFIADYLKDKQTLGKKLLEIGCGQSVWLPYFAKRYGFAVSGIDYSEFGCETSKKILEREGVTGEIIHADLFNPPSRLLSEFDVVISIGVVEHFTDTHHAVASIGKFVKPGGIMITIIPNFKGIVGKLHKVLNKEVYDIHVPLNKQDLERAVTNAGFKIQKSGYVVSSGFPITLTTLGGKTKNYALKKALVLMLSRAAKVVWLMEKLIKPLRAGRVFSPNIIVIGTKQK